MTNTGRPTSQQILNASLSVVVALIGLLWFGLRTQVDRVDATANTNRVSISTTNAHFDEVLRRLERIEAKLDQRLP